MINKVIGMSLVGLVAASAASAAPPCAKKAIHIRLHGSGCSAHDVDHDKEIQVSREIEEPIVWRFTNDCAGAEPRVKIKQVPNPQQPGAGNAFENCAGTGDFNLNANATFKVKRGQPTMGTCTTRKAASDGTYQFEVVVSGSGIQPRSHRIVIDILP